MDHQCGIGTCPERVTTIGVLLGDGHYRISVSPPWTVVGYQVPGEPACKPGAQCIILDTFSTSTTAYNVFSIITTDVSARPRNVVIEPVPNTVTTCN